MGRFRGIPTGPGMALGAAAVVRSSGGIPIVPPLLLSPRAGSARSSDPELLEVLVMAADFETAERLPVPSARVVGIAVEGETVPSSRYGVPVVSGLSGLLGAVADGALTLIDGDRGLVAVDPSPETVAAFQAERERLAPKRRIYLDFVHEPAFTPDGRAIRVFAQARDTAEVESGVAAGADGLYLPERRAIILPEESDDGQLATLLEIADSVGGKPVIVAGDAETVAVSALLRAAMRADLALAMPLPRGAQAFADLREHIAQTQSELDAEDLDRGTVQVAAVAAPSAEADDIDVESTGITRIIAEGRWGLGEDVDRLRDLVRKAMPILVPVVVVCRRPDWDACIQAGASGLVVPPDEVGAAKEAVRGTHAAP